MKKQLALLPIYLNIVYFILFSVVLLTIEFRSDLLLDFRIAYSTRNTFLVLSIIFWFIAVSGITLNIKNLRNLIILIISSLINYFLMEEAVNAFMPW